MRISDWSSDVCSSDLLADRQLADLGQVGGELQGGQVLLAAAELPAHRERELGDPARVPGQVGVAQLDGAHQRGHHLVDGALLLLSLLHQLGDVAGHRDDAARLAVGVEEGRSEEHTSELQSLMRTSYAGFCLKKKKKP